MALQPVVKRSVSGDVFEQIVADVLSGELAPGATLPSERQLAEALGVSRPAVREALQRLAAAGLVSVRQGDATTVLDYRRGAGLEVLPRLLVQAGELDPAVARSILEARLHNGPKVAELAAARAAASGASPTLAEPTASNSTATTDTTAAPVGPSASDTPTALGEPTASNSTTTTDTTAAPVGPSASDTPTALGEPTASNSTAATDAATLSTAADGTSPAHTEPGVDGAAAAIDTSASPTEPAPSNDTSAPLTESTGTADTTAPTVRATSAPPTEGTTTYRTTAAPVGPAARAASITSASTAPTGSTTQHAPTTGTSPARRTARPTTSDSAPSTPFDALVASVEVLAGEEDPVARQRVALDFWDHVVDAADSIVFRLMFNMLRAAYEPALAALAPIMSAEVGNVGAYRELADAITAGRPQEAADIARALLEPATTALIEVLGGH